MQAEQLKELVVTAVDDLKAKDIVTLDVLALTSLIRYQVIASGTSSRHVKSIADNAVKAAKNADLPILGVEGGRHAEWVLVDFGDVVLHVMLPETRSFYDLERLWSDGQVLAPVVTA